MEDLDKTRNNLKKIKEHPKIYVPIVCLLILLFILFAFWGGFLSEKGKQLAEPEIQNEQDYSDSGMIKPQEANSPDNKTVIQDSQAIEQKTYGDQSPTIVSDGNVEITFED